MPFNIKDCTIITRMGGVDSAINLRELRNRISHCPVECLFHHFCETVIRPTFDDPEYRNDLAVWSSRSLRDRTLAERLGVINPYNLPSLDHLRDTVLEVLDERLSEVAYLPWVPRGDEFRFMRAVTVVFDTGLSLESANDLIEQIPNLSPSSIYYHFIEARRRTPDHADDFTEWLQGSGDENQVIIDRLAGIDFYYLTLPELRRLLISTLQREGAPV